MAGLSSQRLRSGIARAAVVAAVALLAAQSWAQSQINFVAPLEGGLGVEVQISGVGFGLKRPKVEMVLVSGAVAKKAKIQILEFSDTMVRLIVVKGAQGPYRIAVTPKTKGAQRILAPEVFALLPPVIDSLSTDEIGPDQILTIYGEGFGPKKGKVLIEGQAAKIIAGTWADSEVSVAVSRKTPFGDARVSVQNAAGTGSLDGLYVIPPPAKILNVRLEVQKTQVWCWAAVTVMMFQYFNGGPDQCVLASARTQSLYGYFVDCCYWGPIPVCLNTASMDFIQYALLQGGGLRSTLTGRISFEQIMRQIDQRHPMILAYQNSFSGHVVVLYGYDLASRSLWIHDPFFGSFARVPYSDSFTYSSLAGRLVWTQTITGIHP